METESSVDDKAESIGTVIRNLEAKRMNDFKPTFVPAGQGPLYAAFPSTCVHCKTPNSTRWFFCPDCMNNMHVGTGQV